MIDKNKLQESRKIQSAHDKLQAKIQSDKVQVSSYQKLAQEIYERDLDLAEQNRKQRLEQTKTKTIDTSPIPSYNIVSQDYYIGFHPEYGVVIAKKTGEHFIPFRLKNRKETLYSQDPDALDKHNDLTRSEFDAILAAKPTWEMLKRAYDTPAQMQQLDNIIKRMSLPTAKVVF